jgi:phosphatidylinositol alpha-1,6-mannosyltransferase
VSHLFVTNDFPPKIGGIQSYLWELWRRLPPESVTILTTAYDGADEFDATQPYRIERAGRLLLPTPRLRRRIERLATEVGADAIVLDPALPVGLVGPRLSRPYAVVLHGAEITVPGRLPVGRWLMAAVVRGATRLIAAGGYPAAEAARAARHRGVPPTAMVPPGVDVDRFRPLDDVRRKAARARFDIASDALLVISVGRLVPRKGLDVLIDAAASLKSDYPDLVVAVAGGRGRERSRLERRIARTGAPVRMIGRVEDADLPAFYGCADVFAQPCRANRWFGLEQEGFGIVFVEAAACGVPQIAGRSGGSHEAVAHGETGLVVDEPRRPEAVAAALRQLLDDGDLRGRMGGAARARAEAEFDYDRLAERLAAALAELEAAPTP